MFEETKIRVWRAEKHRHLVVRHATRRFFNDASRDLDAFTALAGRREHDHRFVELSGRKGFARKQPPLQSHQRRRRRSGCSIVTTLESHFSQRLERLLVTVRHGREYRARRPRERDNELALGVGR
jgi:hypothetical protein